MRLNPTSLENQFHQEGLEAQRSELEEIDLTYEHSIINAALKVSLIEIIDFMDHLIKLDPEEQNQQCALVSQEVSRNILFAKMLMIQAADSDHSDRFRDALETIEMVVDLCQSESDPAERLDKSIRKYRSNGFPFLGFYPKEDAQKAYEAKSILLGDNDSFDDQGLTNTLSILFDSFALSYKDFDEVKSYSWEARLFSKEGFFDDVVIKDLKLNGDTQNPKAGRIKSLLAKILTEYFSSNYAVRQSLSEFLNEHGLLTEQAALHYLQIAQAPTESSKAVAD